MVMERNASRVKEYPVHPVAELFPMMSADEYSKLKEDIRVNGQLDNIVIWNELLIDGRNRLRACRELGIEPEFEVLPESIDPIAWVVSHNLYRRHLTTAQRSMVATKLATLLRGDNQHKKEDASIKASSQAKAAKQMNVSRSSVQKARRVRSKASKKVIAAVEAGEMSLNAAVATTKETDAEKAAKAKAKAAEKAAKEKLEAEAKAAKEKEKAEIRAAKEKEKADAKAEREKIRAEKAAEKERAEAAKAKAKADKEAARAASQTKEGQIRNIKNLIQQHIDKAVRLVDDLARIKPVSHAAKMAIIRTLQGVKTW